MSTAFFTDHYELTMVDAALKAGTAHTPCVFELFTRCLPGGRRYGVLAGVSRALEAVANFRFTAQQLDWLRQKNFLRPETLDYLANFRFSGNISGYAEGEVFFPNSPLLTVEAPFAEGVLIETLLLSILNVDSAVATAASRMVNAARGKALVEMGSRRTSERAAVHAARAAYVAGFTATSNLAAGLKYGIPTMGTAAHAFTMLHESELAAFKAQVAAFGVETTLLVDTYEVEQGVRNAVAAAGTDLGAVRIDSGDLPTLVAQVRKLLDDLGATETKITVTNDLDEYTIAALATSEVDTFGVGTSVVTGSGSPTMAMVYKLVARQDLSTDAYLANTWTKVSKQSTQKATTGGHKLAYRLFKNTKAVEELLVPFGTQVAPKDGFEVEQITQPLMVQGQALAEHLGAAGLVAARRRHALRFTQLPTQAASLIKAEPVLNTRYLP